MSDAELAEVGTEGATGEGAAVVGAERQPARLDPAGGDRGVDEFDRLVGAAAKLERPADDLAGAAVDRRVHAGDRDTATTPTDREKRRRGLFRSPRAPQRLRIPFFSKGAIYCGPV